MCCKRFEALNPRGTEGLGSVPDAQRLSRIRGTAAAQGGKDLEQQIRQKSRATRQLTIHLKAYIYIYAYII